jgi:hypothetical protein
MQEIENDFQNFVDGFYLFSNDSVLELYTKFGYRKSIEYQYSKILSNSLNGTGRIKYRQARPIQMNNKELVMFYVTPLIKQGYQIEKLCKEDTTLSLKGSAFDSFEPDERMFPTLSHA